MKDKTPSAFTTLPRRSIKVDRTSVTLVQALGNCHQSSKGPVEVAHINGHALFAYEAQTPAPQRYCSIVVGCGIFYSDDYDSAIITAVRAAREANPAEATAHMTLTELQALALCRMKEA